MRESWQRKIYFVHVIVAAGLAVLGFGAVWSRDQVAPVPGAVKALTAMAALAILTLPLSARPLWRAARNELVFSTLVPVIVGALSLAAADFWAAAQLPPWPARVLHGVAANVGPEGWGRIQSLDASALRNNSWGQRDTEHALAPTQNVPRIAFVGDSMLEESSLVPLPTLVQRRLGPRVEVLNLGVSATDTQGYYWRVKAVALPLGSRHVVTFFYTGNDFLPVDKWSWRSALIDVPPADSFAGRVLPGITGFLTQKAHVPVRAWLSDPPLHAREVAALERFRATDPARLADELMRYYRGTHPETVRQTLAARDLTGFHARLTAPDMGLFRSYVLTYALSALGGDLVRDDRDKAGPEMTRTVAWLEKMRALTEAATAGLTVVLVPVGYDVDDRFVETWAPLIDFGVERAFNRWRLEQLKQALVERHFDVLDLSPSFADKQGTYLNFDTHWSTLGNDLAAEAVAHHLAAKDHLGGTGGAPTASSTTAVPDRR